MFFDTSGLKSPEITLRLNKTAGADPEKGLVPYYDFTICLADGTEAGHCNFRVGYNEKLYYGGHIGYTVFEPFRGHRYAAKACLLLFELARLHGMEYLYITCTPENAASRKTCEYAGGTLEAIVDLPPDNDMYLAGERQKCVYRVNLP
jgi:tagatose 1,6-diphosphate aldolase